MSDAKGRERKTDLTRDGGDAVGSTPEQFAAFLATQTTLLGEIVRSSRMKVE